MPLLNSDETGFLSDCPSLMLGIAICWIQHSQAMLERGVCDLAHSFFHILMWLNLQVKLKAMKSHEDRIERLNQEASSLLESSATTTQIRMDLEAFTNRWETTFNKICKPPTTKNQNVIACTNYRHFGINYTPIPLNYHCIGLGSSIL